MCWASFFRLHSHCSSPVNVIYLEISRSPGRTERPPPPHNAPRFDDWDTEPPYMVLQPLYATYTDPSRGSSMLPGDDYGFYTCKQAQYLYPPPQRHSLLPYGGVQACKRKHARIRAAFLGQMCIHQVSNLVSGERILQNDNVEILHTFAWKCHRYIIIWNNIT